MRQQTKLTFQIGYAKRNPRFESLVAHAASVICGGCTVALATGFWADDGAEKGLNIFEGKVQQEHTFQLELTCENAKLETAYEVMCEAIAHWAQVERVNTDWVHVSQTPIIGRHFSVKARQQATATA